MGFVEAVKICFRKYITFKGRAPRSEFWWFFLFCFVIGIIASLIDGLFFGFTDASGEPANGPIGIVTSLALILPTITVSVRRLHDSNRSGYWILGVYLMPIIVGLFVLLGGDVASGVFLILGLVAYIGLIIVLIVWYCFKGTIGPNKYGPDPLEGQHKEPQKT